MNPNSARNSADGRGQLRASRSAFPSWASPTSPLRRSAPDTACTAIKIEANALRDLIEKDHDLGYALTRQIARYALERLAYTQAQLAARRVHV
ncbi:MAG: hypothetical protein MZV49_25285 [Rhodopseudomonas palustris]|nr:hypothetical protein [Rhodopseudomonas palustris]